MSQVIDYGGKLCVLDDWFPCWDQPREVRDIWATGVRVTENNRYLIGKLCEYKQGSDAYITRDGLTVYILGGGDACPVAQEERAVQKPKETLDGEHTWRWKWGQWEKHWVYYQYVPSSSRED